MAFEISGDPYLDPSNVELRDGITIARLPMGQDIVFTPEQVEHVDLIEARLVASYATSLEAAWAERLTSTIPNPGN